MGIFYIEKSFRGIRLHISEDIVTEMNAVENEKTGVEFNASVCVCVYAFGSAWNKIYIKKNRFNGIEFIYHNRMEYFIINQKRIRSNGLNGYRIKKTSDRYEWTNRWTALFQSWFWCRIMHACYAYCHLNMNFSHESYLLFAGRQKNCRTIKHT